MLHFLSYSFGVETTNTLIHNWSSFIHDSRPKWAKSTPVFRKNPSLWGGTYLHGLYKGVPPPPPPGPPAAQAKWSTFLSLASDIHGMDTRGQTHDHQYVPPSSSSKETRAVPAPKKLSNKNEQKLWLWTVHQPQSNNLSRWNCPDTIPAQKR